jgi:uncharacterized protein YcfL
MRKLILMLVALGGLLVVGCNEGPTQKSMVDSQKQIDEGNKKLGVEGTQE